MKHTEILRQKGELLIPAIAYGDAAGLPVETRSAQEIKTQYGRIDRLLPTRNNPYFADKTASGFWSDDTQLSIAVAEGLIAADGFDLKIQARAQLDAYTETPTIVNSRGIERKQGWGGSTVAAMERLQLGVLPFESGTAEGAGNGVLMKLAPLVYWQYVRDTPEEQRTREYDQLTTMTHDSDVARLATRIHGDVLFALLADGFDAQDLFEVIHGCIDTDRWEPALRHSFREAFSYLNDTVDTAHILANTDGKGFYAPQTLAMAYGAFVASSGDFYQGIYEAVNLGGDTDSTASIVAAMSIFATKEIIDLREDYRKLDQLPRLERVSQDLAVRALIV